MRAESGGLKTGPLASLVVVERAGRLSASVAAGLLASLGARVICFAEVCGRPEADPLGWHEHPVAVLAKEMVTPFAQREARARQWAELVAQADIVIESCVPAVMPVSSVLSQRQFVPVHAIFTDLGMAQQSTQKKILQEFELQALTGAMAVTGHAAQAPQMIATPILELLTGINGATSIVAALRASANVTATLDLAIYDSAVAFLGTFHNSALASPERKYRDGCRHPLISPWNSYPTNDGRIVLCSTTDEHWHRVASLIEQAEAIVDPRFLTTAVRARHAAEVDELIVRWTQVRSTEVVLEALAKIGIPAGRIATIDEMLQEEKKYQHVRESTLKNSAVIQHPIELIDLYRVFNELDGARDETSPCVQPSSAPTNTALQRPLAGIRILEIGPYTAGPYAGRLLADLGAEVLKIEPIGGEVSRKWLPNFNNVSGYFHNYNAGKKSLFLDFQQAEQADTLSALLGTADVLIQNLGPGALARAGFGPDSVLAQFPRLVYCSISGFGGSAKARPAVDTVVQAASGVMALVGNDATTREQRALKIGLSIADLIAAHVSALSIVARLGLKGSVPEGGLLDISMLRSLAWMTQLAWPERNETLPNGIVLECADGYVFSLNPQARQETLLGGTSRSLSVAAVLAQFKVTEVFAVEVREPYAVLKANLTVERELLQWVQAGEEWVPLLTTPHRWSSAVPKVTSCITAFSFS